MATALIVDDEPTYLERLGFELKNMGFAVYSAANADDALKILENIAVDLLVVDILLPNRANGFDVAEAARTAKPDVAVVVITGHGSREHKDRSESLGAIDYLEKPFELCALRRCAREFLRRRELLTEIHRLEQQLEGAKRDVSSRVINLWPLACLSRSGEVLFATPEGMAALEAVSAPELPRPLRKVDAPLWRRLEKTVSTGEQRAGWITLFRRDGVLSHYSAFVQAVNWEAREALSVLLIPEEQDIRQDADEPWTNLLLKAAKSSKKVTE